MVVDTGAVVVVTGLPSPFSSAPLPSSPLPSSDGLSGGSVVVDTGAVDVDVDVDVDATVVVATNRSSFPSTESTDSSDAADEPSRKIVTTRTSHVPAGIPPNEAPAVFSSTICTTFQEPSG